MSGNRSAGRKPVGAGSPANAVVVPLTYSRVNPLLHVKGAFPEVADCWKKQRMKHE
ncbi:hypothetical protein PRJ_1770 [Pseudomonas sp. XWY-1]|nr:hypothetical protein PRJ_1770 [Pseudomonas sp. XWY-1]